MSNTQKKAGRPRLGSGPTRTMPIKWALEDYKTVLRASLLAHTTISDLVRSSTIKTANRIIRKTHQP